MKPAVTVIDYGVGNLLSVSRAIEKCGAEPVLTASPDAILSAERLILPGVGAFSDGMLALSRQGLVVPIRRYCADNRPFLGICLGMQMMMDSSSEFGHHEGLGLIPGAVEAIPKTSGKVVRKIPHIGWNVLRPGPSNVPWKSTVLAGLSPGEDSAYFVHSYAVKTSRPECCIAECIYDGHHFAAVTRSGNLYGCQFHPEKSGQTGLSIIRNFCELPEP